ncbi:hypothetical protein D9M70_569040 [compost metagenome]
MILVDVSLKFIRGCHHKEIAPLGGISNIHDFKAVSFGLLDRRRTFTKSDAHVGSAGILEVQRMGATLATVADDNDLLCLDQVNVCIAIVIYAHFHIPFIQIVFSDCSVAFSRWPLVMPRKERKTALWHAGRPG